MTQQQDNCDARLRQKGAFTHFCEATQSEGWQPSRVVAYVTCSKYANHSKTVLSR